MLLFKDAQTNALDLLLPASLQIAVLVGAGASPSPP